MRDASANERHWTLSEPTVVVAIKTNCDGCRSFYSGSLDALQAWPTLLIARDDDEVQQFANARHPVYVASELWEALDVRWPPLYVLLGAQPGRILCEGVAFSPEQVARELIESGV